MYAPHVLGVMTGQEIEITNCGPDQPQHPPAAQGEPRVERVAGSGSEPKRKSFPREEIMMPVKCNVHPWMRTYIGVVSHPFFAVSGDDGSFTIKGLPPGEYTLEAIHEKLGTQEIKVKVGAKETGKADFTFKG